MKRFSTIVIVLVAIVVFSPVGDTPVEAEYHGGIGPGGQYCDGGCVRNYCQFGLGCICVYNLGSPCACEGVDDPAGGCVLSGGGCGLIIIVSE